jgi:SAM-dependent methyltransferase
MRELGSRTTLVDLGCGSAPYRELFEPLVGRYICVDLPGNAAADLHLDERGRVPLGDGSVDIVLSSQVLEHVPAPRAYLREAHRILRAGGLLFLSTHGYWMYHPDPTDFRRWTRDGLRQECEQAGFCVQRIRGVVNLAASGLQLFHDGVAWHLPLPLRMPFSWLLNRAMAAADAVGSPEERDRDAGVFLVRATKS